MALIFSDNQPSSSQINWVLLLLLAAFLVALKVVGVIACSWAVVLAPLWLPIAINLLVVLGAILYESIKDVSILDIFRK